MDLRLVLRGTRVAPQPVARACGRICRARNDQERLDATIKAGEVVARYLAALAMCSFSAREDPDLAIPPAFPAFDGNLSFGHFLSVFQSVSELKNAHPLTPYFQAALKKGSQEISPEEALRDLLELRNREGHDLMSLSNAKATTILKNDRPVEKLISALACLDPLLSLPLFLVEDQQYSRRRFSVRRLLFIGESEPIPEEVELKQGLNEIKALYVGLRGGALCVDPLVLWAIAEQRYCFGIYFVHSVSDKKVKFLSVDKDEIILNDGKFTALESLRRGAKETYEDIETGARGSNFYDDWNRKRRQLEQALDQEFASIPWDELDHDIMDWYSSRLGTVGGERSLRDVIVDELLDGRDVISQEEAQQITLLFGSEITVRRQLKRQMIDCRAKKNAGSNRRWDERTESSGNILQCLRLAIDFFGRHVGIGGITLDGLSATSGTADYIAMREGLVNLFIHQDYNDPKTVAQMEITPDQAVFFNAGRSLVSEKTLVKGGKSQSRNPVISRALRRIGFAELAGSGLREVHQTWRDAHRRPPRVESDKVANTFTLTLDWRPLKILYDDFWKNRLGVKITIDQAGILSLLADPAGFTLEEIASNRGMKVEDVEESLQYLERQGLVEVEKKQYRIKGHLRKLIETQRDEQ